MPSHIFYYAFMGGKYEFLTLRDLVKRIGGQSHSLQVWSARLSTGVFGLTSCGSGNKGPKAYNEVLLSVGNSGLSKLVELGFIPCPTCHPENVENFWGEVEVAVSQIRHCIA